MTAFFALPDEVLEAVDRARGSVSREEAAARLILLGALAESLGFSEALLRELRQALIQGRGVKILGPRQPVKNAFPAGTARFPLDSCGDWDRQRAKTFVGRMPREPDPTDFIFADMPAEDEDDYAPWDEEAYDEAHAAWEQECARVRPWATEKKAGGSGDLVYFATEAEAAAYADNVARKAGYILVDDTQLEAPKCAPPTTA